MRLLTRVLFTVLVMAVAPTGVPAQGTTTLCPGNATRIRLLPNVPNASGIVGRPDSLVHTMCNVDRGAKIEPSTMTVYPRKLAHADVGGVVLLTFIVLADGRIDTSSMHVLRSTHELFTKAALRAIPSWHAQAANYRGSTVKQLVEYEFRFKPWCQGVEPEVTPPVLDVRASGSVQICACSTTQLRPDSTVHTMCNVDQDATVDPSPMPIYPALLASAHVDGDVLLTFVVLANGGIDMASVQVLRSTHDLFTKEVRRALASWHAKPAHYRGQAVKQVVEYEFRFKLGCQGVEPIVTPPVLDARASGSVQICP